jgi:hypothetical protein
MFVARLRKINPTSIKKNYILFNLVASILGATAVDFGGGLGFFFDSSSVTSFFFLFSILKTNYILRRLAITYNCYYTYTGVEKAFFLKASRSRSNAGSIFLMLKMGIYLLIYEQNN